MKKCALLLFLLGSWQLWAQSTTENYTKSYEPKIAFSVSQLEDVIGDAGTSSSFTLSAPVSSGTFEAKQSITLAPGFHATGNVTIKIVGFHPEVLENITYTDGLGRPVQSIAKAQSPNGHDIVQFMEYDQFGRTSKNYLPYPTTQKTGNFIADPKTPQTAYYQNQYGDTYAYGETIFDDSPLNRAIETSSPGYDWRIISGSNSDHTTKMEYATNTSTLEIVKFTINDSGASPVVSKGAYGTKELFKNIVKNENWQSTDGQLNTVETYTDKNGRTVATIVFEEVSGTVEKRITQNVYDIQGRLRYILPPKALENVNPLQNPYVINEDLVYQYEYDEYNRQIAQRVPGRDWEYLVYDQLDRPFLMQDKNLANQGKWLFTKYDAFDRPVYSGFYFNSGNTPQELQDIVDNFIANNTDNPANIEKRIAGTNNLGLGQGIDINYTNDAFPKGIIDILSVYYYDDYDFTDTDKPATPTTVQGQTVTIRTQGLQTANFSRTMGENTWTKLYTYYDEKGREIKIHNKNHLGGYTATESKLDFRGKIDLAVTKHKRVTSDTELAINDRFTYDYAERALGHFQKINSQAEERIAEHDYDELGMLTLKKVGGSAASSIPLQELAYEYNIRGQFKALNNVNTLDDKLFAYKINYNQAAEGAGTAPARYDGSISQIIWQSAYDNTKRSYAYLYDDLNRLSESKYQYNSGLNGNVSNNFNTQYTYDEHGNIKSLERRGSSNLIDQLTYNYGTANGNQLLSVSDAGSSLGFIDGNTSGNDYAYDYNGNMTRDLNKGITNIGYNHLDLVNTVSLPSNRSLNFLYDASGAKLQKKYMNGSSTVTTTDYLGGFQYADGNLQFFPTPEGYVYKSGSTYKYMYIYADHLGNTRVSYTDTNGNGTIESSELASNRNYYPFGSVHSGDYTNGLSAVYKYTFQGKEFQAEDGLNWHDFGSRMYDSELGRWMATDPQSQFGSPYLALDNNPILYVDPDGEWVWIAVGAVVGGVINVAANWDNIDNFWEGAAAFGSGALVGGATAACGACGSAVALAAGGGVLTGATNNIISQTGNGRGLNDVEWGSVVQGGVIGGVSGIAGYGAGNLAARYGGNVLINGLNVQGPAVRGALGGVAGAFGGGYASGFTGALLSGANLGEANQAGLNGATDLGNLGIGTVAGFAGGYKYARDNQINPLTGKFENTTNQVAIGRNQHKRVNPAANDLGAETISESWAEKFGNKWIPDDVGLNFNNDWFNKRLDLNSNVFDFGNGGFKDYSPYYNVELNSLQFRSYPIIRARYSSFFGQRVRIIYYENRFITLPWNN
ncbi:RHS repeat-associated core domain-containing protein [Muricauda sp. SCSIO 64092]|uniref:DUF6443 domain-containing protein n=1 Tax=Allomuricauda sp. SCSIO 64092 TaxID=2908842 RepID=UPI001FF5B3A3|nr:DUF6443 domain-containing protein [Muricauda sp. SCSIO 64092]UOY08372.1 RHS repeat-associated core domain-containing protein [Muricauda sp. SCSIO 64092]